MEASVRVLASTHHFPHHRHLSLSLLKPRHHRSPKFLSIPPKPSSSSSLSFSRSQNPLGFLLSLSSSFSPPSHPNRSNAIVSDSKDRILAENQFSNSVDGGNLGFFGEKGPDLTVVLLGWLGAETKHLKRYADLYSSRGIRSVCFVVPVSDALGFDLGRRVEGRIAAFVEELIEWLSETEKDGRERGLVFHTFSNTGWLAYGAILENMQKRGDLIKKIKGCVIDSGGDPEINPQVWAAGFSAAILKKRGSLTNSVEAAGEKALNGEKSSIHVQDAESPWTETMLLCILEKFFSMLLKLPYVNRRLAETVNILSNNQPPCPQLYLYSTADKVIPVRSVELFIQEQKKSGRKIRAYNFGSSPHVDHLRSFSHIYSTELHNFLKECISDYLANLPHCSDGFPKGESL